MPRKLTLPAPVVITKRDEIGSLVFFTLHYQPDKKTEIYSDLADCYGLSRKTIRSYAAHWLRAWKARSQSERDRILRTLQ